MLECKIILIWPPSLPVSQVKMNMEYINKSLICSLCRRILTMYSLWNIIHNPSRTSRDLSTECVENVMCRGEKWMYFYFNFLCLGKVCASYINPSIHLLLFRFFLFSPPQSSIKIPVKVSLPIEKGDNVIVSKKYFTWHTHNGINRHSHKCHAA